MTADEIFHQIAEYVRLHPDASTVAILGTLDLSPEYRDTVERAKNDRLEGDPADDTPTLKAGKTGRTTEFALV